jgi:hypothetical protein
MNIEDLRRSWQIAQQFIAGLTKVFVVGCPKSGTTWVMNQLDGHPRVVVKGEGRFAWRLVPMVAQAFNAFNEDQKKHSSEAVTLLRDVDLFMSARQLIDTTLWRYIEISGKQPSAIQAVGDKTPQHSQNMGMLNQLYPEARFISVMRDPRDAATSALHHFGKSDGRSREEYFRHFIQEVWPAAIAGARQSAERLGLGARFIEVRYEDLHRDERGEVRRMLGLIGVDAANASIDACVAAGSFKARAGGRERGNEDKSSFYRRGVVADWLNHMTPQLAEELCAPIAGLMRDCGYDPQSPKIEVTISPNLRVSMPLKHSAA